MPDTSDTRTCKIVAHGYTAEFTFSPRVAYYTSEAKLVLKTKRNNLQTTTQWTCNDCSHDLPEMLSLSLRHNDVRASADARNLTLVVGNSTTTIPIPDED